MGEVHGRQLHEKWNQLIHLMLFASISLEYNVFRIQGFGQFPDIL
jgi:hypothetical protein